mgnify:CR=1 FL=1
MKKIVIVGGVAGGATVATRIRRLDEKAQIIILEKDADDAILKFALQDLGLDLIREIVRRSPIYSELAQEI